MQNEIMERNKCLKSKLKVIKNQIENEFKREKRSKIDNQKENINWKKNIQFNILFDKFKNKIEKLNSNLVNVILSYVPLLLLKLYH